MRTPDDSLGIRATDSMAERYGLFIIIVLGEVVLGVVDGMTGVKVLDFRVVATGVLGLGIDVVLVAIWCFAFVRTLRSGLTVQRRSGGHVQRRGFEDQLRRRLRLGHGDRV
jgi:low temperature requirement protein LtrA